ncbi:MAG: hypothetical protein K2N12_02015 [Helicobacter sp.]|nr:hypothetical protein [Helicobacter sp.]
MFRYAQHDNMESYLESAISSLRGKAEATNRVRWIVSRKLAMTNSRIH